MSFLFGTRGKKDRPKQKLLGLDELRAPTNEQARPVVYLAGTQRAGITYISDPIGFRTEPVGKMKKGGATQHNYFASFATALCHGVLGSLRELWFDDERVWTGPLNFTATDSDPITVADWGSGELYWGTATQPIDPILGPAGHPPYRRLAYIVWDQFGFGTNRTTPPAIEWVGSRAPVVPGWFPGSVWIGDDVNPMAIVCELFTNARFGIGTGATKLDSVTGAAVATRLAAESFGISVALNRAESARQLLAHIFESVDGWWREDASGLITFGLIRQPSLVSLPHWDESGLVDDPRVIAGSWGHTASAAQVRFTDSSRYWKENTVTAVDGANAVITQEIRSPVYDRPWITKPLLAAKVAQVIAQQHGRPIGKTQRRMRRSVVGSVLPGDIVAISHAHHDMVMVPARVESISYGAPGTPSADVDLTFETGDLNQVFATPAAPVAPTPITYTPVVATYERVVELPRPLAAQDSHPVVALIAARPSAPTDRYFGHVRQADGSYESVADDSTPYFGIRCHALAAVPASTFTVWNSPGLEIGIDGVDGDLNRFTSGDYANGRVLALVGTEFLIVRAAVLTGALQYRLTVERGAHFTAPAAASSGAEVWLVYRDHLLVDEVAASGASTQTYKMQPSILGRRVDLASCVARAIAVDRARLAPPPPENLRAFGDLFGPTWAGSVDVPIAWDPVAIDGPAWLDRWGASFASAPEVELEFRNGAGTVVATVALPAGSVSYLWTFSAATGALGSAVDFSVRARHRIGSLLSQTYAVLNVTRV